MTTAIAAVTMIGDLPAALIRAKWLRIRLVNGLFRLHRPAVASTGATGTRNIASMTVFHGRGGAITASQASGLKFMSAQRMTLESRKPSAGRLSRRGIGRGIAAGCGPDCARAVP